MLKRTFLSLSLFLTAACTSAFAQNCTGANCLVISQVYGGGGNTGGQYRNDFIEIFNRGSVSLPLTGYSVQYASATGSSWQVTNLTAVTLAAGQYYLIQEAVGSNTTAPALPTPDATGTIPLSATAGQIALVNSTTALSGACPSAGASVIDVLGFGASSCTPSVAVLSNTTAALRNSSGCYGGVKPSASNGATPPVSGFSVGAPAPETRQLP